MRLKRLIDICFSIIMLILLSPLMLFVSVAVAITMGRPVIFRQRRRGWKGVDFQILKFRTMKDCYDHHGKPLPDCVRITRLGTLLRDWSLDELPQLINVLAGDMSLVGPRPMLDEFIEFCTVRQLCRYETRPGITGLAQICGRKNLDYSKRFELDLWYIDHLSVFLDLGIMVLTPVTVFRRYGCVETGAAVTPQRASEIVQESYVPSPSNETELLTPQKQLTDLGK